MSSQSASNDPAPTVLVLADPKAGFLRLLDRLRGSTSLVIGNSPECLAELATLADVIVNCFQPRTLMETVWRMAPRVSWVHTLSAGLDNTLFPELVESPVPLTNARAVYSKALAEFVMTAILCFAKDVRRMLDAQAAGQWTQFDVEWVAGKTLGIVGYGAIGRESARLAKALGMKVMAVTRRPAPQPELERIVGPEGLCEMLAACDYVAVCTALTRQTRGLIGDAELRVMKPSAVVINVCRGPVIVEEALLTALGEGRIRGAALDVFDQEPLPARHPFYALDNVLLSFHCADHTPGWSDRSMESFLENFERFRSGKPLENIVDKRAGY